MNIAEILNNFLLEGVLKGKVTDIFNDLFPTEDGECLISRHDPSTANETEFIDGSAIGSVSLSYYMRSKNGKVCREILNKICDTVDNLVLKDIDGNEIRINSVTLPSFISEDDKHLVVYSVTIEAEYNRNGE